MNRLTVTLAMFAAIVLPLTAQNPQAKMYAESFRHGATLVTEEKFEVKLTPQNANYKELVKDSRGDDRYILTIVPQGPVGDTKITSWRVQMADLRHAIYPNVLITSPNASSDPKDLLGWLNPERYAAIPTKAKRIIKVDNFYVLLEVTAFHFTPTESPYLDSMDVQIQFTNTDPRTATDPK